MDTRLLCCWLGVPDHSWPPDALTLLGLESGEPNLLEVETQVQERMARLRCYQVSHPEEATEGMNRLAQAFIEVTEKLDRRREAVTVAVARLPGGASSGNAQPGIASPERRTRLLVQDDTAVEQPRRADWRSSPPPVRQEPEPGSPPEEGNETLLEPPASETMVNEVVAPLPVAPSPAPAAPAPPVDPIVELARHSREARRGLGTLNRLLERIHLNRALRLAWCKVGKYLKRPDRKLKPAEENDLSRRMDRIFRQVLDEEFPGFMGRPGLPGYRVVAMARLEMTAQMFKVLGEKERQDLARDWAEGEKVLLEHHRFLRQELRAHRRRSLVENTWAALMAPLRDHPGIAGTIAVGIFLLAAWFLLR